MKVRKIVAGLAAVSMLAAFSAQAVCAADTVSISAENVSAAAGSEFTLNVSMDGLPATGLSVCEFALSYDADLVTVTGVTAGEITENGVDADEPLEGVKAFESNTETAGLVTMTYSTGLSDAKYCITESGVFATITGTVSADAADGTKIPIKVVPINRETTEGSGTANNAIFAGYIDADGNVTMADVKAVDGSITVGSEVGGDVLYGDSDVSGDITIADVITLNKYLLGDTAALTEQGKANADVDESGTLDSTDSLNILKACVQLLNAETDFPIGK